ncbi:MAG: hypothetical protein ACI857_003192 [Arenicella sp.]|jgi:hypothetical protein
MRWLLLIFLNSAFLSFGQIPNKFGWTEAGANQQFFDSLEFHVDFDAFKKEHPQIEDNSELIGVIEEVNPKGVIIDFRSSEYFFEKSIKLDSKVILRGDSIVMPRFVFRLNKINHLILVQGRRTKDEIEVLGDFTERELVSSKDPDLKEDEGYWLYYSQDDQTYMTSDWANRKSGQIIYSIFSNEILSHQDEIRLNYNRKANPTLCRLEMTTKVGIENISIINETPAEGPHERFSNIAFIYANNCWVKNVESQMCNYAHIQIDFSAHCSVTDFEANDAFSHGGGGVGYGVVFQNAASSNLLNYSSFNHLRHSILFQIGANGNVVSRNTSTNPYWTGNLHRKKRAGDIVFHGNYPYCNLVIKNKCKTIVFDRSHGYNGPANEISKNECSGYGIIMSKKSSYGGQSFFYNKILKGKFKIYASNSNWGNTVKGKEVKKL